VYERPASEFVAGFVGLSNLLDGALALAATGRDQPVLVRPEKMRLEPADAAVGPDDYSVAGIIEEATYLGPFTRFRVAADPGGRLAVLAQNRAGEAAHDDPRGRRVRVVWARASHRRVHGAEGGAPRS
jgi:putative spermidine/putrescine transport system ATP-binding protein